MVWTWLLRLRWTSEDYRLIEKTCLQFTFCSFLIVDLPVWFTISRLTLKTSSVASRRILLERFAEWELAHRLEIGFGWWLGANVLQGHFVGADLERISFLTCRFKLAFQRWGSRRSSDNAGRTHRRLFFGPGWIGEKSLSNFLRLPWGFQVGWRSCWSIERTILRTEKSVGKALTANWLHIS